MVKLRKYTLFFQYLQLVGREGFVRSSLFATFASNTKIMGSVRLDKYLWAVRIFKTRSDAAEAIRNNRVLANGAYCKPSREVRIGETLTVKKGLINYSYKVLDEVSNRQPAKNVELYILNTTPPEELAKLNTPRETIFVMRDPGTGRPTKRDRRQIDSLMEDINYDDED